MSSIKKMTIQGIRSYGPKDQDTQVIEFFTPVTLIVGQNGSGKTTIIECLKYATTSDMPPNTKGSSFVFDPKLIDEVETKGRIKLYFNDTSGLTVQVQKNLSSTQKAKKCEFRTLETIISRYNSEGKLASTITSKCINADGEVINAFGVSKAVLEHVIFCHQEDSNWPLSDGKLLKTRFDEIFAATKYIKSLDTLKKIRLEKNQQIKQLEIEKKHLETYKSRSEQLNRDLEENNKKLENLTRRKDELTEKLKPINQQLDFYLQESARIFDIKTELDKFENEKSLIEKQIKELLASTKDCLFTGSDSELREYMQTYIAKTDQMKKDEEYETSIKIEELKSQLKEINLKKSKLTIEVGALENKHANFIEKKKELNVISEKACLLMHLNEIDPKTIDITLKNFISEYQEETTTIQEKNRVEDLQIQSKVDSERENKSKIDQSILNKKEIVNKCKRQMDQIEDELKMIQNDRLQTELNTKIADLEADINKETKELIDLNEIKNEVNDLETKKSSLKKAEASIDSRINEYHMNSKVKTEINLLKNDIKSKQDQIRKIKIHIEEDFENFFQESDNLSLIKSNDLKLKSIFESESKELSNQLQIYEDKRKEIEKRLCSSELKRKMLNDELRLKESQLRTFEDKLLSLNELIVSVDDIDKFNLILEKLQDEQKSLLDEKGFLSGVDKTYKRFLQQLQIDSNDTSNHSCPVCMRLFKDLNEIHDTVNELKKYTSKLPQKMTDLDFKLKQTQTKLDQLINSKSIKESYDKIKNEELQDLKSQLESYDRNILPKLRAELKENDEILKKLDKRKSYSNSLQNEIVLIDKCANECNETEKKIDFIIKNNRQTDINEDSNDLVKLNEEKSKIQTELKCFNHLIESKQNEINKNYSRTDRINNLKEKLNEFKTKRNELALKTQKKGQLLDKQDDLLIELNQSENEIEILNTKLRTSTQCLNELVKQREEIQAKNNQIILKRNKYFDDLKDMFNKIRDISEFVNNFEKNDQSNLTKLKRELNDLDVNEREINHEIECLRQKLDDIKMELARHEIKKRELIDNMKLREKRQEYEIKNKQFLQKKEELKLKDVNLDIKNFKQEQKRLELKRDELLKELNDVRTSLHTLDGRMQTIKEELSLDNYKNALEKYMICASDLRVLEYSVLDIEKYYKALDRAIMNYHLLKMNEINKIIKQLWRQVYRGNDIDYIEIRSEEESANEEQIKSRRTYNYRVVLIKGDTSLDMRGRCSAGQKVLASIIIRLALAETFCLNSGILALDEPTTNLDRENIESLASALVEIIKARSMQKNFQLVIITHDEDFVEMLGRSEYMDQFYRVQKDENGFSRIFRRTNLSF